MWYPAAKPTGVITIGPRASGGVGDWNYCDMKCISLEKLVPNVDFFVVTFRESIISPDVSVCYGKSKDGAS